MKTTDLIQAIEHIAPLELQASWDNSGVQVATTRSEITHLAVMLDPTLPHLHRAIQAGADAILAHHPLSMKPQFLNTTSTYFAAVSTLITNQILLYSAHTSLDANPHGPVRWLAAALQLTNVHTLEPLTTETDEHAPGFGFIGTLPTELSYDLFCHTLHSVLGKTNWQVCGPLPSQVRTIACCPGSGSSMLPLVERNGVDVFITGDVKYHTALDTTVRIIDVGHFSLEEEMMRKFCQHLQQTLPITVSFFASVDPLQTESVN